MGTPKENNVECIDVEVQNSSETGNKNDGISPAVNKRNDLILIIVVVLVKFGDAVEVFLPGVITQQVSCDLGVTQFHEDLLGVIMYISLAASTFLADPIATCFGKRIIILASLYISIGATILSAIVHSYHTLVISRAFVGFCVGLNNSNMNVLFAEIISSNDAAVFGLFLVNFCYAFGSGWVSILGYFLLELLGWRNFVLVVSIPWFIPPIILFHCSLTSNFVSDMKSKKKEKKKIMTDATVITAPHTTDLKEQSRLEAVVPVPERNNSTLSIATVTCRILKFSLLKYLEMFLGSGTILLLPALLRATNLAKSVPATCGGAVGGSQFLIMAGISGGVNLLAKPVGFYLFKRIPFRGLMVILTIITTVSYGTLTGWNIFYQHPSLVVVVCTISAITAAWSMMLNETIIVIHDPSTFGLASAQSAAAIVWGFSALGTAGGNALASFLSHDYAVICNCALCVVQIVAVLIINERDSRPLNKFNFKFPGFKTIRDFVRMFFGL